MFTCFRLAVATVAVAAGFSALWSSQHGTAPQVHADPLPCIVIDGGALGIDHTVTVCPHI